MVIVFRAIKREKAKAYYANTVLKNQAYQTATENFKKCHRCWLLVFKKKKKLLNLALTCLWYSDSIQCDRIDISYTVYFLNMLFYKGF